MTRYTFRLLSFEAQVGYVHEQGTYLTTRWQDALLVLRYHLPGEVFAELTYEPTANAVVAVRCFAGNKSLAAYAAGVLPE